MKGERSYLMVRAVQAYAPSVVWYDRSMVKAPSTFLRARQCPAVLPRAAQASGKLLRWAEAEAAAPKARGGSRSPAVQGRLKSCVEGG